MIAIRADAVRHYLDWIASGRTKYVCQFHVEIHWPKSITRKGSCFYKTGKEGIRRIDGVPSAEYSADRGQRLWLGLDGKVERD